jgi:hypothetical protein
VARTLKVVEVFAVPEKIQEEAPAEDRMAMAAHG